MKQMGLFSSPNPNDRDELMGKAYIASKWLKIIAIVSLVLVSIIGLIGLLIAGVAGAAVGAMGSGSGAGGAAGAVLGVILALIVIGLSAALAILTLWYASNIKKDLENDSLPSLTLAYVLLVLSGISALSSIVPSFNIIGLLINLFMAYLWFTVIQCVTKINELGDTVSVSTSSEVDSSNQSIEAPVTNDEPIAQPVVNETPTNEKPVSQPDSDNISENEENK